MGTTAEKINRLTQTKSDLKTVINYTGANITEETIFKEYPKLLNKAYIDILNNGTDDLYDALPKATGIGSNLTLNTEEGKMKITLNSSALIQDGTPSPDYPQDVEVVTGEQNLEIVGKNIFNKNDVVNNYYIDGSGNYVSRNGLFYSNFISINPNNTYAISGKVGGWTLTALYDKNKSFIKRINDSLLNENLENVYYIRTIGTQDSLATIQLEYGTTATDYIPHQEQNYPIDLHSKNLFDKDNVKLNYTWNNTPAGGRSIFFIETKPNETYTISASNWNDLYYDIVYLDHIGATTNIYESGWINPSTDPSRTFTTTAGTNILGIHFKYQSTGSTIMTQEMFDNATIQLEEGTIATNYEPYYNMEYCKIGDYEDQIFKNTIDSEFYDSTLLENEWYLKKNIDKVTFGGSDDEVYERVYGSIYNNKCLFFLRNIPHNNSNYQLMKSNRFVPTSGVSEYYPEGINTSYNSGFLGLVLNADRLTEYSVEALKTFFQNNNTDVYLVTETPQYIHISTSDYPTLKTELDNLYNNAQSYDEQTNITASTDNEENLILELDVSALAKIE